MSKVITGNPGVGKHTVAVLLAKKLDLDLLDINEIAIKEGVFVKKAETLDVNVKALQKILDRNITKTSLVVGHLAPYVMSRKKIEEVIVLRKSPYNLYAIYKKRKYSKQKIIENLGSEILGITYYDTLKKFGPDKTFQIDTTNRSVSAVIKKIEDIFENHKSQGDTVDWLDLVLKKGDLTRFFPY